MPADVNLGGSETASQKACDEQTELLETFGARLGYRFALRKAVYDDRAVQGEALVLRMRWANRGSARCCNDRDIVLILFDGEGATARRTAVSPDPPTSAWRGEREVDVAVTWPVPDDLAPGTYTLKLGLRLGNPRAPDALTCLANPGEAGPAETVTLGRLTVAAP